MWLILFFLSIVVLFFGLGSKSIAELIFLKQHPFFCWFLFSVITLGAGIITLPVAFRLYKINIADNLSALRTRLTDEANKFIETIKTAKALPTINPQGSLFLDIDEHLILKEPASLRETRSIRQSSGSFGSMRVGRRFRVGGYSGTSAPSLQWATLDKGTLFLTNKKIIFVGGKENRNIVLKHIVLIQTFLDAIGITTDSRSKAIQFTVANPYIWSTCLNITRSAEDPFKLDNLALDIKLQ